MASEPKIYSRAAYLLELHDMHIRCYHSRQKAYNENRAEWVRTDAFMENMLGHYNNHLMMLNLLDEVCDAICINDVLRAMGVNEGGVA